MFNTTLLSLIIIYLLQTWLYRLFIKVKSILLTTRKIQELQTPESLALRENTSGKRISEITNTAHSPQPVSPVPVLATGYRRGRVLRLEKDNGPTNVARITMKPLITNTSEEFIKCHLEHFLMGFAADNFITRSMYP